MNALQEELQLMLNELESSALLVVLVPQRRFTNHGGMVRVAAKKNARWYRDFCGQFGSSRGRRRAMFDTRIKRRYTVRLLRRLIVGTSASCYASVLIGIAARRMRQERRVA